HRSRQGYLPERPARPWIYAIVKRVLLMHVRTVYRREMPEATDLSMIPEPHDGSAGDAVVARLELTDALRRIPAGGRRAFLMHHWSGLSFREIAEKLGIDPGAAKLRSSRAATRLRRLLQRTEGDGGE